MSTATKLLCLLIALIVSAGAGYRTGVKLTQANYSAAESKAKDQTLERRIENDERVQTAQDNRTQKIRIVERDSAGTLSELELLRNALRAKPTGDATIAAAIERADTIGKLLESCSAEYQSVARAADGHALDVITLRDAWPR